MLGRDIAQVSLSAEAVSKHFDGLAAVQSVSMSLAPGEIELRKGGSAKLDSVDSGIVIDSTVSECEVPRLLEYSLGAFCGS